MGATILILAATVVFAGVFMGLAIADGCYRIAKAIRRRDD